jgi:NAD(P)-dependent dehydrogenase (short-subunit alcohol dehydrogenase family)
MVARTVELFGVLDAAFNNAGIPGGYSTAVSCTNEEWEQVNNINMRSIWLCMKHQIPEMLKTGGGSIVNMASRAGDSANLNMFTYAATKHGVVGMTRSAALDFATQNVLVNALLPGLTQTPMLDAKLALHICENDYLNAVNIRCDGGFRVPYSFDVGVNSTTRQ